VEDPKARKNPKRQGLLKGAEVQHGKSVRESDSPGSLREKAKRKKLR